MYPNQNHPYLYQPIAGYKPQEYMQTKLGRQQIVSGLRVALQTIETASRILPLIAQLQPMLENAKTALHVVKAMKTAEPEREEVQKQSIEPTSVPEPSQTARENPILFDS